MTNIVDHWLYDEYINKLKGHYREIALDEIVSLFKENDGIKNLFTQTYNCNRLAWTTDCSRFNNIISKSSSLMNYIKEKLQKRLDPDFLKINIDQSGKDNDFIIQQIITDLNAKNDYLTKCINEIENKMSSSFGTKIPNEFFLMYLSKGHAIGIYVLKKSSGTDEYFLGIINSGEGAKYQQVQPDCDYNLGIIGFIVSRRQIAKLLVYFYLFDSKFNTENFYNILLKDILDTNYQEPTQKFINQYDNLVLSVKTPLQLIGNCVFKSMIYTIVFLDILSTTNVSMTNKHLLQDLPLRFRYFYDIGKLILLEQRCQNILDDNDLSVLPIVKSVKKNIEIQKISEVFVLMQNNKDQMITDYTDIDRNINDKFILLDGLVKNLFDNKFNLIMENQNELFVSDINKIKTKDTLIRYVDQTNINDVTLDLTEEKNRWISEINRFLLSINGTIENLSTSETNNDFMVKFISIIQNINDYLTLLIDGQKFGIINVHYFYKKVTVLLFSLVKITFDKSGLILLNDETSLLISDLIHKIFSKVYFLNINIITIKTSDLDSSDHFMCKKDCSQLNIFNLILISLMMQSYIVTYTSLGSLDNLKLNNDSDSFEYSRYLGSIVINSFSEFKLLEEFKKFTIENKIGSNPIYNYLLYPKYVIPRDTQNTFNLDMVDFYGEPNDFIRQIGYVDTSTVKHYFGFKNKIGTYNAPKLSYSIRVDDSKLGNLMQYYPDQPTDDNNKCFYAKPFYSIIEKDGNLFRFEYLIYLNELNKYIDINCNIKTTQETHINFKTVLVTMHIKLYLNKIDLVIKNDECVKKTIFESKHYFYTNNFYNYYGYYTNIDKILTNIGDTINGTYPSYVSGNIIMGYDIINGDNNIYELSSGLSVKNIDYSLNLDLPNIVKNFINIMIDKINQNELTIMDSNNYEIILIEFIFVLHFYYLNLISKSKEESKLSELSELSDLSPNIKTYLENYKQLLYLIYTVNKHISNDIVNLLIYHEFNYVLKEIITHDDHSFISNFTNEYIIKCLLILDKIIKLNRLITLSCGDGEKNLKLRFQKYINVLEFICDSDVFHDIFVNYDFNFDVHYDSSTDIPTVEKGRLLGLFGPSKTGPPRTIMVPNNIISDRFIMNFNKNLCWNEYKNLSQFIDNTYTNLSIGFFKRYSNYKIVNDKLEIKLNINIVKNDSYKIILTDKSCPFYNIVLEFSNFYSENIDKDVQFKLFDNLIFLKSISVHYTNFLIEKFDVRRIRPNFDIEYKQTFNESDFCLQIFMLTDYSLFNNLTYKIDSDNETFKNFKSTDNSTIINTSESDYQIIYKGERVLKILQVIFDPDLAPIYFKIFRLINSHYNDRPNNNISSNSVSIDKTENLPKQIDYGTNFIYEIIPIQINTNVFKFFIPNLNDFFIFDKTKPNILLYKEYTINIDGSDYNYCVKKYTFNTNILIGFKNNKYYLIGSYIKNNDPKNYIDIYEIEYNFNDVFTEQDIRKLTYLLKENLNGGNLKESNNIVDSILKIIKTNDNNTLTIDLNILYNYDVSFYYYIYTIFKEMDKNYFYIHMNSYKPDDSDSFSPTPRKLKNFKTLGFINIPYFDCRFSNYSLNFKKDFIINPGVLPLDAISSIPNYLITSIIYLANKHTKIDYYSYLEYIYSINYQSAHSQVYIINLENEFYQLQNNIDNFYQLNLTIWDPLPTNIVSILSGSTNETLEYQPKNDITEETFDLDYKLYLRELGSKPKNFMTKTQVEDLKEHLITGINQYLIQIDEFVKINTKNTYGLFDTNRYLIHNIKQSTNPEILNSYIRFINLYLNLKKIYNILEMTESILATNISGNYDCTNINDIINIVPYYVGNNCSSNLIIFEYIFGNIVRPLQVRFIFDLLNELVEPGPGSRSGSKPIAKMHQLLMGQGKSSVVAPLLTIFLLEYNFTNNIAKKVIHIMPETLVSQSYTENFLNVFFYLNSLILSANKEDIINIKNKVLIISDYDIKYSKINNVGNDAYKNILLNSYLIFDEVDEISDPLKSQLNVIKDGNDYEKINNDKNTFVFIYNFIYDLYFNPEYENLRDLLLKLGFTNKPHLLLESNSINQKAKHIINKLYEINIKKLFGDILYDSFIKLLCDKYEYIDPDTNFDDLYMVFNFYKLIESILKKLHRRHFGLRYNDFYNIDVLYSESRLKDDNDLKNYFISIPYLADEKPSKKSEFTDSLFNIALTIISYLDETVNRIRNVDIQLFLNHVYEVYDSFDEKTADLNLGTQYYNTLINGITYPKPITQKNNIISFDSDDTHIIMQNFKHNYLQMYLIEIVLTRFIKIIRFVKNISFVDILSSRYCPNRIGFTGTPFIYIPQEIDYNGHNYGMSQEIARQPGGDGAVVSSILGLEQNYNLVHKFTDMCGFYREALTNYHVIIDVGSFFINNTSLDIAKTIMIYIKILRLTDKFKCVVFINEKSEKLALDIEDRIINYKNLSIPLINRFYFYDQAHITGIDMKIYPLAKGLVTVSSFNRFRDVAQGIYRMRNINRGQTVDFIVKPNIYNLLNKTNDSSPKINIVVNLLNFLISNEINYNELQKPLFNKQNILTLYRNYFESKNMYNLNQSPTGNKFIYLNSSIYEQPIYIDCHLLDCSNYSSIKMNLIQFSKFEFKYVSTLIENKSCKDLINQLNDEIGSDVVDNSSSQVEVNQQTQSSSQSSSQSSNLSTNTIELVDKTRRIDDFISIIYKYTSVRVDNYFNTPPNVNGNFYNTIGIEYDMTNHILTSEDNSKYRQEKMLKTLPPVIRQNSGSSNDNKPKFYLYNFESIPDNKINTILKNYIKTNSKDKQYNPYGMESFANVKNLMFRSIFPYIFKNNISCGVEVGWVEIYKKNTSDIFLIDHFIIIKRFEIFKIIEFSQSNPDYKIKIFLRGKNILFYSDINDDQIFNDPQYIYNLETQRLLIRLKLFDKTLTNTDLIKSFDHLYRFNNLYGSNENWVPKLFYYSNKYIINNFHGGHINALELSPEPNYLKLWLSLFFYANNPTTQYTNKYFDKYSVKSMMGKLDIKSFFYSISIFKFIIDNPHFYTGIDIVKIPNSTIYNFEPIRDITLRNLTNCVTSKIYKYIDDIILFINDPVNFPHSMNTILNNIFIKNNITDLDRFDIGKLQELFKTINSYWNICYKIINDLPKFSDNICSSK